MIVKNYEISLYKFNQALIKDGSLKYWVEKYILQNISDIDNIENLKIKNNTYNLESINIGVESDIGNYDAEHNLEQLNILSIDENYDSSIQAIQNSRLIVKISECNVFSARDSKEIDKIPDFFFKKRNLLIIKNVNNNKCFLYCFIRKFKNIVSSSLYGITKKDLEIVKEIMDECNIDFENVSLDKLDKIEKLLEVNIHIFVCNKKFNSKKLLESQNLILIKI